MFRVEPSLDPSIPERIYVEDGWQRVAGDVPFRMEYPGSAHFVARDEEGAPVGVASVVHYPPPAGYDRMGIAGGFTADPTGKPALAWIGGMNVRAAWRGRGVGRALLAACVEVAQKLGTPVVALDATEAGRKLYARAGFQPAGSSGWWMIPEGQAPAEPPEDDGGFAVHPTGQWEALDVVAFDGPRFGAHRGLLVSDTLARAKDRAFVAFRKSDGQIAGYVAADEHEIGPLVADHPAAARLLLHAALGAGAPRAARLWDANPAGAEVFAAAGFRPTGLSCARMTAGGPLPGRPASIYAIRGWAWG